MATKTVACPSCGSAATPGRYTCSECGAFLDGVSVGRRPAGSTPPSPDPAPVAELRMDDEDDGPSQFLDEAELDDELAEPVDPTVAPPPDAVPEVQWPPAGDRGALTAPEPRVPAGAYLPPSDLLVTIEPPSFAAAAATATLAGPARPAPRAWLEALGTPERRWEASRRTIAIGSVVTLFGFLLPWASAAPATLLNVWLSVWGLAGAGHWLIVLAVLGVGAFSALAGRAESVPLGVPAIGLGSAVLGLVWPTVFGAANRPIGILVVLVGAIVLIAGGIIQLGARHEAATPDV